MLARGLYGVGSYDGLLAAAAAAAPAAAAAATGSPPMASPARNGQQVQDLLRCALDGHLGDRELASLVKQ